MNKKFFGKIAITALALNQFIFIGYGTDIVSKNQRLKGFCYGPFRDNENPDMGIFPLTDELKADIEFIGKITKTIRTYGCVNTFFAIPELSEKLGIDCYPGAWLSKDKTETKKEVESLIRIGSWDLKNVKGLIVGNEVLLRKDMLEEELIDYIREVKKSTHLPVTTAETWSVWKKHQKVAKEVNFLMVHIHPYWEGVAVDKAASYVVETWKSLKENFPEKKVVIGETGWPSEGKSVKDAVPNKENQARFFKEFTQLAEQEGIDYFYFELFDEKWKDKFEGKAGAHWGIYNSDGSLKDHLKNLVPTQATETITRPPRKVLPVEVIAPLIVYKDVESTENGFQPSGWMGDIDCIEIDKACETNPYSGKTCTRIAYKASRFFSHGWSGVYWQFPLNNWGDYPGYKLTGAAKLTFWVRGEKGSEKAEFKTGGISSFRKPYRDSFGPISTGVVKLSSDWQKITINLKNQDTTNLIGGFCWTTNYWQNSKGCIVYLDDIQFEP